MQATTVSLAAIACLASAGAVAACETLSGEPRVQTRKPVQGEDVRLVSGFGMRWHPILNERRMHQGVDWAAPPGTPVIAAGEGRVVSAGVLAEYGTTVLIDHGAGWQTLYAHLAGFDVREGDCVTFGAVIGKVGSTGLVAGPKLHFEVHRDGKPIDPQSIGPKSEAFDDETKQ